jgi:hypothetical protein
VTLPSIQRDPTGRSSHPGASHSFRLASGLAACANIADTDLDRTAQDHGRHRFIAGKLLAELSLAELCTAADGTCSQYDMVLDKVAVLTYTPTITADMNKILAATKAGGMVSVTTTDAVTFYREGKLLLLPEVLAQIDGLEVRWQRPSGGTNGTYLDFQVIKKSDHATMPPFRLISRGPRNGSAEPAGACSFVRIYQATTE